MAGPPPTTVVQCVEWNGAWRFEPSGTGLALVASNGVMKDGGVRALVTVYRLPRDPAAGEAFVCQETVQLSSQLSRQRFVDAAARDGADVREPWLKLLGHQWARGAPKPPPPPPAGAGGEYLVVEGETVDHPWPSLGSWKDDDPAKCTERPRVLADVDRVRDLSRETFLALDYVNGGPAGPRHFDQGGVATRLVPPPAQDDGRAEPPRLEVLDAEKLRYELNERIDFFKREVDEKTGAVAYRPQDAPGRLVTHLMGTTWSGLPVVERVTTAPSFAADGGIASSRWTPAD
jgi:hypothetical protein